MCLADAVIDGESKLENRGLAINNAAERGAARQIKADR